MRVEATARARRWWVFLAFAVLVVIAAAWSVFWVMAARRADAVITAWLQDEARRGRIHGCGSRTSGGYPFRIEVRCTDPSTQLTTAQPPRVLKAKELRGVAQVYDPGLIIAEISGRLSVVFDGLSLERVDGERPETWAAANHLEFHMRRDPAAPSDKPRIDFAAQMAGATVPGAPLLRGKPLDGEVTALVSGLNDLTAKPVPRHLKEWQAAGGRLEVTRLRLQQGDAVAVAAGD